jgi:hypothetical protein
VAKPHRAPGRGPLPRGPHPAALRLQRAVGNRATTRLLERDLLRAPVAHAPGNAEYAVTISGETVQVKNAGEETRAKAIIDEISTTYRIAVSSLKSVKATKDHYANAPQAERDKVATLPWSLRELIAVKKALDHFAPILGRARGMSTRRSDPQEITTLGSVNTSITHNTATGVVDPDTLGEFYASDGTFAIYTSSQTSTVDFPGDVDRQMEATTTHEIAHGLMHYMMDAFIAASGFWLDEDTKSHKARAETPPTDYGHKNAREDLSESVMLYFVAEARLKRKCPKRWATIRAAVAGWDARGDYPMPDADATTALA